jgi:predicted CoA-binding protein
MAAGPAMMRRERIRDMHETSVTDEPGPDFATRHARYPEAQIRKILNDTRTIALVGASANPARPSWIVLKYLLDRGYAVIPVNPGLAGQDLLGRRVVPTLAEVSEPIDMVEIFRNSAAAGPLVDEALALDPRPKVIWMQLGVRDDAAAARAEAQGITVIMNRCPKIEYGRLSGEIGWTGVNSRILSARKPVLAGRGVQRLTIADRGKRPD